VLAAEALPGLLVLLLDVPEDVVLVAAVPAPLEEVDPFNVPEDA